MQVMENQWEGGSLREGWFPLTDTPDLTLFPGTFLLSFTLKSVSAHLGLPKSLSEKIDSGVSSHLDSGGPKQSDTVALGTQLEKHKKMQ